MSIRECPDCDGPAMLGRNNGKCSECHGSGCESDVMEAFVESLIGEDQTCQRCHGSGSCLTCGGDGYIDDSP